MGILFTKTNIETSESSVPMKIQPVEKAFIPTHPRQNAVDFPDDIPSVYRLITLEDQIYNKIDRESGVRKHTRVPVINKYKNIKRQQYVIIKQARNDKQNYIGADLC